jgi:hypothetical protein
MIDLSPLSRKNMPFPEVGMTAPDPNSLQQITVQAPVEFGEDIWQEKS